MPSTLRSQQHSLPLTVSPSHSSCCQWERGTSEAHASCMCVCVRPFNPMNCSLPGFSILAIFQARILEWVTISSSRGSGGGVEHLHLVHWQVDFLPLCHLGSLCFLSISNIVRGIAFLQRASSYSTGVSRTRWT